MRKYLSATFIKENILIILVTVVAFVLRFTNLGYSDFQGDEIKALFLPPNNTAFFEYIMDQRKGPVQFIITFLLKFLNPQYNSQLMLRFPFALAGFFAVVLFYKFVKIHFGKKIALFSTIFFATNGFMVAFSRIVQYQSFVIFFMVASLYYFSLAGKSEEFKIKGIYYGFITWAFSLLSHYDGIFIFPFVIYLIFVWLKRSDILKKQKIISLSLSVVIFLVLLLSFYIPFLFSISDSTKQYWMGRITGEVSSKISSSTYLFMVYQPIYAVHIYKILFFLGSMFIFLGLFSKRILKIKNIPEYFTSLFTHTTELMNIVQNEKIKIYALGLWIGIGVLFFEKFVYISGTHIYTYLIPCFILLAIGFVALESAVFKIFELPLVRMFNIMGLFILFAFLAVQSYAVFVDSYKEYPWEDEDFLLWRFNEPDRKYHLSLFGFPYYRSWEEIGKFVKSHPEIDAYSTNEGTSISRHYVDLEKDSDKAGFYIFVKNPQSYTEDISNDKVNYWINKYDPQFSLTRNGRDMVRVYMMEKGTAQEIIEKGF